MRQSLLKAYEELAMNKMLNSKYGLLIFSLLSGLGYFALIMVLISETKYSGLLGLFFMPAIVCGAALCIFKTVKNLIETEQTKKVRGIIIIHAFLIVFSVAFWIISCIIS